MNPSYEIERHPFGWLICAPPGQSGLPLTALAECLPLFKKKSVLNPGIAHHFNASHYHKQVIAAVAAPQDSAAWEKAIAEQLKDLDPQDRWWRGTEVGTSSAALFAVFCRTGLWQEANRFGRQSTPQDASDFVRCKHLLDAIPEWRTRLGEVAVAYPGTPWPQIVARWGELETAPAGRVNEILRECQNGMEPNP
jgi:hypothetical protein